MRKGRYVQYGLTGLLCLALIFSVPAMAVDKGQGAATLGIYSVSDMGGRYYGLDPLSGDAVETSYLQVASAMQAERAAVDASILVDCGNALAGVPSEDWEEFSYAPAAEALRAIGCDYFVPGLAEFRLSAAGQGAFFSALSAGGEDAPVTALSANYLSAGDGTPQLAPYQVTEVAAGSRTFKIGVLGLSDMDMPNRVPGDHYTGSTFAHEANTENSYAWEWANCWQAALGQEDCSLVVVVCHAGMAELEAFVSQTTGIDLVLCGDSGRELVSVLQNQDGEDVPCVSSGGTALTRTLVTLYPDGTCAIEENKLLSLTDYSDDPALAGQLSPWGAQTLAAAGAPLVELEGSWADTAGLLYSQSREADLVCQAMCWAAGTDLALLSPARLGTVSLAEKAAAGEALTLRDCWALYPQKDSALYAVELTGRQLKAWMGLCAARYQLDPETLTITGSGEDIDILYGLDCETYLGDQSVSLTWQGEPVADNQIFTVAVDAARLDVSPANDPYGWYSVTGTDLDSGRLAVWPGAGSGSITAALAGYLQAVSQESGGTVTATRASRWQLCPGTPDGPITRLELISLLYELADCPAPGADIAFIDVNGSNAVIWAAETGVASGNGLGKFLPTLEVTREQAAAMIFSYAKASGHGAAPGSFPAGSLIDFDQISDWARPAVEFCCKTGVLPGTGGQGNQYLPGQLLTRAECRAVLQRLEDWLSQPPVVYHQRVRSGLSAISRTPRIP